LLYSGFRKALADEKAHGRSGNISVVVWAASTELDRKGSREGGVVQRKAGNGSQEQLILGSHVLTQWGRREKWEKRGGSLGQKNGPCDGKLDRAVLERWTADFEERTSCSGKTNGPIKVEDFGLDSKVVLFSFEKILFISITNLVYKSQDVTWLIKVLALVVIQGLRGYLTMSL
jgi:hypothetical protein